jgi:hypothetical protein
MARKKTPARATAKKKPARAATKRKAVMPMPAGMPPTGMPPPGMGGMGVTAGRSR